MNNYHHTPTIQEEMSLELSDMLEHAKHRVEPKYLQNPLLTLAN